MIIHPFLIKKGGEEPVGDGYRVRFYDYDGTLLKTEYVETGGTAVPPTIPDCSVSTDHRPALAFQTWNNSIYNISKNIDNGAIYKTLDGKTYMYVTLNNVTGYSMSIKLNKTDTSTLTINWGDGTSDTNNSSGDIVLSHTYVDTGDYIITTWISSGKGYYKLGDGVNGSNLFNGDFNISASLKKIFIGDNITAIQGFCFDNCLNLKTITSPTLNNTWDRYIFRNTGIEFLILPVYTSVLETGLCANCYSLKKVIIPDNYNRIRSSCFAHCYNLSEVDLPTDTTIIEDGCFSNNRNLQSIIIPFRTTTIRTVVFINCTQLLKVKFLSTNPPTFLNENMFNGINPLCKIYVPDASLDAYKTAEYLSYYADYIYPLSEEV